jgi:hypothetical protein
MPTREEMIAALRSGDKKKPSREEMIAALRNESKGTTHFGLKPGPDFFDKNADIGTPLLQAMDATGGFIRSGLANVAGLLTGKGNIVSEDDLAKVAHGQSPQSDEYYERLGVPKGPSMDLNPWMEGETSARGALGFLTDAATGSVRNPFGPATPAKPTSELSRTAGRFGKPTADQVEKAAQALGIKPTKGMLTDDYVVRNLEDSLSQSPSIPGSMVRGERAPIFNTADDVTQEALEGASVHSPVQAGKDMRAGVQKHFQDKLDPLEKSYDEIASHTKNIDVNTKGLTRIANNIRKIEGAEFQGSDAEKVASQFAGWLESATTVDTVKRLRSKALAIARDKTASDEKRHAAGEIAKKLFNAQTNTITRQAVKVARDAAETRTDKGKFLNKPQQKIAGEEAEAEGLDLGRRLVGDIKTTNKGYRGLMDEARTFGKGSGLTKANRSAQGAIDDIGEANAQDMASALFDSGNIEFTEFVKKTMPQQFEMAKAQRLAEIAQKVGGSPQKLATLISKMTPEEKMLLFGDEVSGRLDNVATLLRSLPAKVGPSGTPHGLEMQNILSPTQNMRDIGRYGLLKTKGLISPTVRQAVGQTAKQVPRQGLINTGKKKDDKRSK